MKIHEYQAKQLLVASGVPVPKGIVARTPDEAAGAFAQLGTPVAVVKSQIHAGGRGKGAFKEHPSQRGVVLVKSAQDARDNAARMLGKTLVTKQTGPDGKQVNVVFVEAGLEIARELYLGIVVDRSVGGACLIMSSEGGMEIEEVAAKDPKAILMEHIDPTIGFQAFHARKLAFGLGLKPEQINEAVRFMTGLYKAFVDTDASLCEINPFITTTDGRLFALDAKMNFDDNALFRHKDLKELRDITEEDPLEVEASKYSLNYIKLDGNIACMVNGAGLAMATMDIIKYAGGSPANFLDVGGGANAEQIQHAFEILLSDKNVKALLINIFGGILRVDMLASAVVEAAKATNLKLPLVLRLEGTNVEQGREILRNSGLNFIVAENMKDAAEKVVSAAK